MMQHGTEQNRAIRSFLTYQDLCFRSFARSLSSVRKVLPPAQPKLPIMM